MIQPPKVWEKSHFVKRKNTKKKKVNSDGKIRVPTFRAISRTEYRIDCYLNKAGLNSDLSACSNPILIMNFD